MSRARSTPAMPEAKSAPCRNENGRKKARNECVGKPGQVRRRPQAVRVHGHQHQRERQRRDPRAGLPERAHDRAPRDQPDLMRHCSSEPSSVRPVFARKTSSSDGSCRLICAARRFSASSARTTSGQRAVAVELHRERAGARGRLGAEAAQQPAQPLELVGRLGHDLDGRLADLRLQLRRRALGDDAAVVDDPDAVGEDVGLLEVLRRQEDGHALLAREAADLVPERGPALRVEARSSARRGRGSTGRGSARAPGRAGASSRPSRCAPCGCRRSSARRGRGAPRSARLRSSPRMPCRDAWSRRCSRPVRNGSSAASWSAAPIDAAYLRALLRDVEPGHGRAAARGREERRQHVDGRRLAGAVRAEEAVDLARAATRRSIPATASTSLKTRRSPIASIPSSLRLISRRTYLRPGRSLARPFARYT